MWTKARTLKIKLFPYSARNEKENLLLASVETKNLKLKSRYKRKNTLVFSELQKQLTLMGRKLNVKYKHLGDSALPGTISSSGKSVRRVC